MDNKVGHGINEDKSKKCNAHPSYPFEIGKIKSGMLSHRIGYFLKLIKNEKRYNKTIAQILIFFSKTTCETFVRGNLLYLLRPLIQIEISDHGQL